MVGVLAGNQSWQMQGNRLPFAICPPEPAPLSPDSGQAGLEGYSALPLHLPLLCLLLQSTYSVRLCWAPPVCCPALILYAAILIQSAEVNWSTLCSKSLQVTCKARPGPPASGLLFSLSPLFNGLTSLGGGGGRGETVSFTPSCIHTFSPPTQHPPMGVSSEDWQNAWTPNHDPISTGPLYLVYLLFQKDLEMRLRDWRLKEVSIEGKVAARRGWS